jgi:hypothetical protein
VAAAQAKKEAFWLFIFLLSRDNSNIRNNIQRSADEAKQQKEKVLAICQHQNI